MMPMTVESGPVSAQPPPPGPGKVGGCREAPVAADWSAPAFVGAVWVLMLLLAVVLVFTYGSRLPCGDDWQMIPVLVGQEPITASWLWSQVGREGAPGEHRWPLAKACLVLLAWLSGYDFRAGMLFQAGALAALALAMIWTARRLRSRTSYTDAFFPIVLLNWGHSENLLWWWQVCWVLPTVIAGSLLAFIASRRAPLSRRAAFLVWGHLGLLFLCGSPGVALIPTLAVWLGYSGWSRWRSPQPRDKGEGLWIITLAALALLLVPLYFVGFVGGEPKPNLSNLRDIETWLKVAAQCLAMSLGSVSQTLWHWLRWPMVGLLLLTVAGLGLLWFRRPEEGYRAAGLFWFLGGVISLALGLAWGRFWVCRDAGLAWRYSYLGLPALCCVYLSGVVWAAPAGRLLQMVLFTLACVLWPLNTQNGFQNGNFRRAYMCQLEHDLEQRIPPAILAERHFGCQCGWYSQEYLAERLRMLRRAGVGEFHLLRADSTCRESKLPALPSQIKDMVWADGEGYNFGDNPAVTFALETPRRVYAVRLKYRRCLTASYPGLRLLWGVGGQDTWNEAEPEPPHWAEDWALRTQGAQEKEERVTIWVDDTMDRLRVLPDKGLGRLRITAITLLLPEAGAAEAAGRDSIAVCVRGSDIVLWDVSLVTGRVESSDAA